MTDCDSKIYKCQKLNYYGRTVNLIMTVWVYILDLTLIFLEEERNLRHRRLQKLRRCELGWMGPVEPRVTDRPMAAGRPFLNRLQNGLLPPD